MPIRKIYAQIACRDLASSTRWFETLFGRKPDATPMAHLAEWHHGSEAGLQLFENADAAGKTTMTVIVSDLAGEKARIAALQPGDIEPADYVSIIRLRDLDGNLIVLAEPRKL